MKKLKIGYFADGPWSHKAFNLINEDKRFNISFIVPRNDTTDFTLKELAEENNIPYLTKVFINSDEFYEIANSFRCDLFVSMSYNQIFRNRIINLPPLGTINCHAGKLPFYRGRNILNWALINDEKEFGITVHFVDEGIDTGDIILQRTFPITYNDNYATLLIKAYTYCAEILFDALVNIYNKDFQRVKQSTIHPVGFYCGIRGEGDENINWNDTSRNIFNFIRALCKPGPIARSFANGNEIKINKASIVENAPEYINTPGQILAKTPNGFFVKTKDTFIEVSDIESDIKLKVGLKMK